MVSAIGRDAARTFTGTILLLLLLVGGLPVLATLLAQAGLPAETRWLALFSPWTAFTAARSPAAFAVPGDFWLSLGLSHVVAWGMLATASFILPRSWQDEAIAEGRGSLWQKVVGSRVAKLFRVRRPVGWLDGNPILWLMGERSVLRILLWVLAGGWVAFVLISLAFDSSDDAVGFMVGGWAFLWVFMLALVEHSCRFWVEARQNGTLEALLSVPIESRRIIACHWASIRHHFMWPMLTVIVASTVPAWWGVLRDLAGQGIDAGKLMEVIMAGGFVGGLFLTWTLANFFAIGWTGMWLALKLKRPQFASGMTLLCILSPYLICWLGIGATIVLIVLPMSLVQGNLRGMILQHYTPVFRQSGRN